MKVGIVGAGATGLAAAYDLVSMGHTVSVYEADQFVGGQASTIEVGGSVRQGSPVSPGFPSLLPERCRADSQPVS